MADGVRGIVERRRGEQAAALDVARRYAADVATEVPLVAAVVFGSYARGDFNTWSDIDVLVISDRLRDDAKARLDLLWRHVGGGVSPIGRTPSEHQARRQGRDPIAVEADAVGIVVAGAVPPTPRHRSPAPAPRVTGAEDNQSWRASRATAARSQTSPVR